MKISADLSEFIGLLNSHKVEFILVGAHALAWHGLPRYTKDIDFLVNPESENSQRLMRALARLSRFAGLAIFFQVFGRENSLVLTSKGRFAGG